MTISGLAGITDIVSREKSFCVALLPGRWINGLGLFRRLPKITAAPAHGRGSRKYAHAATPCQGKKQHQREFELTGRPRWPALAELRLRAGVTNSIRRIYFSVGCE
jgi:hypothetical protein